LADKLRQSETLGIHFINLLADELRQSETLGIHFINLLADELRQSETLQIFRPIIYLTPDILSTNNFIRILKSLV
jgi:hypothetical protein